MGAHPELGDWLTVLRRYLAVMALGNLAWEFAHVPLYTIWETGTAGDIVFAAIHCTGGDILIALSALVAALLVVGSGRWPKEGYLRVAAAAIVIGIGYTVFSEWLNIEVRQSWAYQWSCLETNHVRICCVCGARPNFMKLAAVTRAMDADGSFQRCVVHTGQHYDENMFKVMFDDLGLPRPDIDLGVNGGSHAHQTGEIMKRFEPVVLEQQPDLVMVVGDVNSTVACTMVATKLHIPVAHIESGLRSFDRTMPEEINRVVTDAISDLLFVSERSGVDNLRNEGIADEKVFFVGNVMIDTLLHHRQRAAESDVCDRLGIQERRYAVLTLHRPNNVDDPVTLERLVNAIGAIQSNLPVVFPVHPRTAKMIDDYGLARDTQRMSNLLQIEPVGYLDFLKLMADARVILTDSGGIQEEATILRVPCLTLRENTERPATIEAGFNRLVGSDPVKIVSAFHAALDAPPHENPPPEKWDGRAGQRIVQHLKHWQEAKRGRSSDEAKGRRHSRPADPDVAVAGAG